jgi:hypothetical protein
MNPDSDGLLGPRTRVTTRKRRRSSDSPVVVKKLKHDGDRGIVEKEPKPPARLAKSIRKIPIVLVPDEVEPGTFDAFPVVDMIEDLNEPAKGKSKRSNAPEKFFRVSRFGRCRPDAGRADERVKKVTIYEKVFANTPNITKAIRFFICTCFNPALGPLQVLFTTELQQQKRFR